mmetsp:Transcript_44247/g.172278  ORF Transcript_44247/g.172278 Transcript_44247/m.172278 type:complete len:100 (-) Transcript_44247:619-918(-)
MNLSPRKVYRGNNLCRFSTRSPELLADNQQETADLVKKFPESLALDVEERCRKNVETLKTQYRMDDKRYELTPPSVFPIQKLLARTLTLPLLPQDQKRY